MLQIKITVNDNYSIAEQAQLAVEAGCAWPRLDVPDLDEAPVREQAAELITLCRESGVILTMEGRAALARELGIHGVFVPADQNAIAVRNEFGPEAIIGTVAASASSAVTLSKADIDFLQFPRDFNAEEAAKVIADTRNAGCDIPFVAETSYKEFNDEFVAAMTTAGFAGFVSDGDVFNVADPVREIENMLRLVQKW